MADLIDRGKLIDHIMESDPEWCIKPIRPIFDFITGMPSAERRARWEYVDYGGVGNWHCSACRAIGNEKYNYCPNCGAKMGDK